MKLDIDFHKIDLPVELMQICGVSAACVYAVLSDKSNEDGICNLSRNEIAKITGLKNRTIPDLISKLEVLGVVERQYNPGYATTYHVTNILPGEQPEVRAAEQEEVPAEPTEPARQSEQQPELKPGYQYYGEYQMIPLLPEEYKKLGDKYGRKKTDKYIAKMEIWMMKKNSNRYDNYFGALADWMMTDAQRLEQAQKSRQKYRPMSEGEEERQEELDKYLDLIN